MTSIHPVGSEAAISIDEEYNNGGSIIKAFSFSSGCGVDDREFNLPISDDIMEMREETYLREDSAIFSCKSAVKGFLNKPAVEYTIISLIAINAIMLGIGTFDFITTNTQAQAAFDIIDLIFLIFFTIELALRVFSEGKSFYSDFWLLFDLFLIATSWMSLAGISSNLVALRGEFILSDCH